MNLSPAILRTALQLLLRPLAGWCVRHGVKLQDLQGVLKEELVKAAQGESARHGAAATGSRLAAMTGVHRKDVATLLSADEGAASSSGSLYAKIIGAWQQGKRFRTGSGRARTLSYEGKGSEFASLVQSVSSDLNSYTVLSELERMGVVARGPRGLRLAIRAYQPRGNQGEGYRLLSTDLADLLAAVESNMAAGESAQSDDAGITEGNPPEHHAKTEYDNVPVEVLPEIREWIRREGAAFHQRARNYLSSFDRDLSAVRGTGRARVALGSFSRVEENFLPIESRKGGVHAK